MKKFIPILLAAVYFSANAQTHQLPPRPSVLAKLAPFYHGVASGDPLSDRVMIWTRVTTEVDSLVSVSWQMATDTGFSNIAASATVTTDSSADYTVKVDVTGLQAGTWYYYRFKTGGIYSLTGRTRTAPMGSTDSLRFAIFSCSDFQSGFFNAYHDIAYRNDIDAVMHLGDWYYEYKATGSDYQGDTSRLHPLTHDAYTYSDYILWHSQYRLDQDLRDMLQQYPLISIWDDHDVANNAWHSGAQNHNSATQGDWFVRKAVAFKAYYQWMPIRPIAPGNDSIMHRSEKWGDLLNWIMLDTRYEGRDSSPIANGIAPNAYINDTNRTILGAPQLAWVKSQLSDNSCKWRLLGNQVMIAPLLLGGIILNPDQWDGYPADRQKLFDYIMNNNIKNVVFLSGDIHSSWANDLPYPGLTYTPSTTATPGTGSVATEFIGSSITSTAANIPGALLQAAYPNFRYVDFVSRGYLLFDVTKKRVQGDYIHMSTVASRTFRANDDAQWMNLDGERFLRQAPVLGARPGNPILAPFAIPAVSDVKEVQADNMIVITCYPNPSANEVTIQYYLSAPGKVDLFITAINGQVVYKETAQQSEGGLYTTTARLDGLAAGTYVVSLSTGAKVYSKQVVKLK